MTTSRPLPLTIATQLKKIKEEKKMSYAELGKQIGLSGTMLSARVVHCENNPDGKVPMALSRQSYALVQSFLAKKEEAVSVDKLDTAILITELKKRGATSIVF